MYKDLSVWKWVLTSMRKWANEWGIACLAAFVAAFFGTFVFLASEYGQKHIWQTVAPMAGLTVALLGLTILGMTLGYLDVKKADRERERMKIDQMSGKEKVAYALKRWKR